MSEQQISIAEAKARMAEIVEQVAGVFDGTDGEYVARVLRRLNQAVSDLVDLTEAQNARRNELMAALAQIVVIAEFGTTGLPRCDNGRTLTRAQVASMRASIAQVARDALFSGSSNDNGE